MVIWKLHVQIKYMKQHSTNISAQKYILLTMQQEMVINIPAGHVTRQKYAADRTDVVNCCHVDTDGVVTAAISRPSPASERWDCRRLVVFSTEIWELEEPAMYNVSYNLARQHMPISAVSKCTPTTNKLRTMTLYSTYTVSNWLFKRVYTNNAYRMNVSQASSVTHCLPMCHASKKIIAQNV